MVSLKHEISLSSNFDLSSRKFIHTSLFHHEQGEKVNWTNKHTKCEVHDSFCQLFFFFFFPLKEKRIVRKKTASVTIWGFILQSLLTPPESGYRWWNISYYFPKNTVELRKTCFHKLLHLGAFLTPKLYVEEISKIVSTRVMKEGD